MIREDIQGHCNRVCIYNDNGRCDMWDELSVPSKNERCDSLGKDSYLLPIILKRNTNIL